MTETTDSRRPVRLMWAAVGLMLLWFGLLVFIPATQPSGPAFAITGIILLFAIAIATARLKRRRTRQRSISNA